MQYQMAIAQTWKVKKDCKIDSVPVWGSNNFELYRVSIGLTVCLRSIYSITYCIHDMYVYVYYAIYLYTYKKKYIYIYIQYV